jgi:hypothetical protein
MSNLGFSWSYVAFSGLCLSLLGLGFAKHSGFGIFFMYFSGQLTKGFMMTLISIIHFPFLYFLFMDSSVGLNYNSGLTFFFQKFCKNYSGLPLVNIAFSRILRFKLKWLCSRQK